MLTQVLPQIECEASSQQYGRFVISPLESGYGITLGNALRRVLLSSLPGAAVTSVRVSDVPHEFATIPHVKEDMTAFILNVKQLRFKIHSDTDESYRIYLSVTQEGEVAAADLQCPSQVEVVNPELHLLTADSNEVNLDIEMVVSRGRGYSPAEERGKLPIGEIPVDAIFSPVRKANFQVSRTRVGQMTNYDRLVMEIWTDGTITPETALIESARILVEQFSRIARLKEVPISMVEREEKKERIPSKVARMPIEDLGLSVRAFNCLKRAGISTVGEILHMLEQGEDELLAIRNFGRKSLGELLTILQSKGFLSYIDYTPSTSAQAGAEEEEEEEDFIEDEEIE
ncbi:MAG: DNA-directed RNA polymerase subunit alpha [Anaerolineae bacterium]